jgi:hypothetical protein
MGEFGKWSSNHGIIDDYIRQTQLGARNHYEVIEWIPFDRLVDIEDPVKGDFGTVCKAKWLDGRIISFHKTTWSLFVKAKNWHREGEQIVYLKNFDRTDSVITFLQEVNIVL